MLLIPYFLTILTSTKHYGLSFKIITAWITIKRAPIKEVIKNTEGKGRRAAISKRSNTPKKIAKELEKRSISELIWYKLEV